jgi:hypothetical protein
MSFSHVYTLEAVFGWYAHGLKKVNDWFIGLAADFYYGGI